MWPLNFGKQPTTSKKLYKKQTQLQRMTNRKLYVAYGMAPFCPMIHMYLICSYYNQRHCFGAGQSAARSNCEKQRSPKTKTENLTGLLWLPLLLLLLLLLWLLLLLLHYYYYYIIFNAQSPLQITDLHSHKSSCYKTPVLTDSFLSLIRQSLQCALWRHNSSVTDGFIEQHLSKQVVKCLIILTKHKQCIKTGKRKDNTNIKHTQKHTEN